MKAIILAAGKGERMRPLTFNTPKPLILLLGKPLLYHLVSQFPKEVDELILVVGYLGDKIRAHCGTKFLERPVHYVEQSKPKGTYHALKLCKPLLKNEERFFMFYADDLIDKKTINNLLEHECAVAVSQVDNPERFGVATLDENGIIKEIVEKPENPASNLAITNAHLLNRKIFRYKPPKHQNGEYYLSIALAKMAKKHAVKAVKANFWFPIATPEDLTKAEKLLLRR